MIAGQGEHRDREARRETRTSLFAMATLYADSGSWPIKVRDLSSAGALIDGAHIPPTGTDVQLCRGSRHILAEIVWRQPGRAGLTFKSSISVSEWLPQGLAITPQQRLDEKIQEAKTSGTLRSHSSAKGSQPQPGKITSVDLTRLRLALESLAEDLADDPVIVKRHMAKLQTLDMIAQALKKLAAER